MNFDAKNFTIIERNFINESDVVRHDPEKLAHTIIDLARGWIK
jgi:hypothetical protein